MTTPEEERVREELLLRLEMAIRTMVRVRLGPGALETAKAGEPVALSGREAHVAALAALTVVEPELDRLEQDARHAREASDASLWHLNNAVKGRGRDEAEETGHAKRSRVERAEQQAADLRYERRLLGAARMVLDLVAAGDPARWEQLREEAGDVAQRIVDEIGHPVTDEPALGPGFRRQLDQVRALADEWEATIASGVMRGQEWEQCLRANLPRLRAALGVTEETDETEDRGTA